MAEEIYDVGIIGSGPGDYVAAIRAAQLGGKVVVIEKGSLGGTCTNVGCIPTKAILKSVELLSEARMAPEFGLVIKEPSFDFKQLMAKKDAIVNREIAGIDFLLNANGVKLVRGRAVITSPKQITVTQDGVTTILDVESIIIATGSRPRILPIPGVNSKGVITSDDIINTQTVPASLLIYGGGAEAAEFACVFSKLGCKVTIATRRELLRAFGDVELGNRLAQALRKDNVTVNTFTNVTKISEGDGLLKATLSSANKEEEITVEQVLLAIGRDYNVEDIGLETVGVNHGAKGIIVNDRMETNVKDIYAIGDVTGGEFAHVASEEGIVAAENIMGGDARIDLWAVPRCVYSTPEVAGVGLTETQAKEKGYETVVGRFPFSANGRALTLRETEGVVKFVADKKTSEILGVSIIGPRASDMIPEVVLAMQLRAKTEDLVKTIHPHPTLSETIKEAALDSRGASIHVWRKKLQPLSGSPSG